MKQLDIFCKNCWYEDVAQELFDIFGLNKNTVKSTKAASYNFFCIDIEFWIHNNHEIEDDMGIKFSNYPVQISLIKLREGEHYQQYNQHFASTGNYLVENYLKN